MHQLAVSFSSRPANTADRVGLLSPKGAQAALLFYAILPIVIIYPLLQRYFVTGLTIGAVKG